VLPLHPDGSGRHLSGDLPLPHVVRIKRTSRGRHFQFLTMEPENVTLDGHRLLTQGPIRVEIATRNVQTVTLTLIADVEFEDEQPKEAPSGGSEAQ
jgi:hypothetical protein